METTKEKLHKGNKNLRIKKILPSSIYTFMRLLRRSVMLYKIKIFDLKNFKKAINEDSFEKSEFNIIMQTHILEKGLSHGEIRYKFGEKVLNNLSKCLSEFISKEYDKENLSYKNAISVLREYKNIHETNNIDTGFLNEIFSKEVISDIELVTKVFGGSKLISIQSKKSVKNFSELTMNRYSIREFSDSKIEMDKIEKSIEIAQKSPSACNRQSVRVHVVTNRNMILELLNIQNGYKGYRVPKILLITTVDQVAYSSIYDRNMGYIDGGLFTMTLLYALEERLIGACLLNTNFSPKVDKKIKSLLNMKESDIFINFIPIGNIQNDIKVCKSQRIPLDNVIIKHN